MLRLLATAALAVAALVALAWPFSVVGISATVQHPGARISSVSLYEGRLSLFSIADRDDPKPTAHDQYDVELGPSRATVQQQQQQFGQFRQTIARQSSGGPTGSLRMVPPPPTPRVPTINARIRLWWLLAGAGVVLLLWAVVPLERRWRRRRRGRCLACGYGLAGAVAADAKCPECGLAPAEARERTRLAVGRLVRDAGVVVFVVLLACSAGAWSLERADRHAGEMAQARVFDYSWYLASVQPRLSGAVMFAAPGGGPNSLGAALGNAGPGTTIVLLPGEYSIGQARSAPIQLRDVWLLGCGRENTTLAIALSAATRVRIEGVTIDCRNESFTEFRDDASMHLRDCQVMNYNSGSGGSDAISASDALLLIEDCEFEGKSGRAASGGQIFSTAMDLRGRDYVYIRGTRFSNNRELFRNVEAVLDRCTVTSEQSQWFSAPFGGSVYKRALTLPESPRRAPVQMPALGTEFTESLDDAAILARLVDNPRLGAAAWTDKVAVRMARTLGTARDPGFWTRLLLHPSAEVRALAAKKLDLDPAPASGAPSALEDAVAALDKSAIPRDAALTLLAGGDTSRARLRELAASGSAQQKGAATALLRLMDASPTLPEVVRYRESREKK